MQDSRAKYAAGLPKVMVTLAAVVAHEDARFAAMVVLEKLSPDQRVAFVLHDGFGGYRTALTRTEGGSAGKTRNSH